MNMRVSKVKTITVLFLTLVMCASCLVGCSDSSDAIAGSRNKMFRAAVTKVEGTQVTVQNSVADEAGTYSEYRFENKSETLLSAGEVIIIKYTKVKSDKLTVSWWNIDTSDISYAGSEVWIEEENASDAENPDALKGVKLEITEIYNDCFFAKLKYLGTDYTIKVNTILPKTYFVGDIVTAELSNVTMCGTTKRMEGETAKVSMDVVANA